MVAAAERELREELGPIPLSSRPRVAALIVLTSTEEVATPALILEAVTPLTFDQLRVQFQQADPTEGYHESSGQLVGLSSRADSVGQSFRYILEETSLRPLTRVATLLALTARLPDPRVNSLPTAAGSDTIRTIHR